MSDINAPNYTEKINDIITTYEKIKELKRNYEAQKEQTLKQLNILIDEFKQKTNNLKILNSDLTINIYMIIIS